MIRPVFAFASLYWYFGDDRTVKSGGQWLTGLQTEGGNIDLFQSSQDPPGPATGFPSARHVWSIGGCDVANIYYNHQSDQYPAQPFNSGDIATQWDSLGLLSLSLSSPECWHAEQSVKIGTMAPPIQHNTARYVSKHSLHLSQLSTLHTRDYLRCCLLLTLFDIEISSSGWFSSRADSYRIWVITEEHNCDHWSVDCWPAGHQTNSERERERESHLVDMYLVYPAPVQV